MDTIESIEAAGQQSTPDKVLYEKYLASGQFTSPSRHTLSWVGFVGWVANDPGGGVRVLVLKRGADTLHEVVHPGFKIEGPGLVLEVVGNDLEYTVTEHQNISGPRLNKVIEGKFVGLAAPDGVAPAFTDVSRTTEEGRAVAALAHRKIMNGYGDTFKPRNSLTRGQFALVLARLYGWV